MGQLLEAGTLLNLVRSVQADDTFYDRVVWVQQFAEYVHLLMVVLTVICSYQCMSTFITILFTQSVQIDLIGRGTATI